jgi:hypothetical protein
MKTIFRRGVHSRKWPRHLAYAILVMLLVIGWMLSVSLTSTSTFAQEPVDPPTEEQPAPTEIPTPTPTPTEAPAPMDPPAEEPAPTDPPAEEPAPTDPPAEEPAPTETPTATPVPTETPVPLPSDPPTISSDKADYAPGELVTLTGANWQGDDQVRIIVNDDWGSSWRRDEMVPVADDGTIVDTFNLPTWFVATYSVVATGQETGRVATTSFTDAADITLSKHRGQQKAADGTLSWPSGSQNTTIYAETEPINFRFEVATSVTDAVGQVQIEFSKEDATCNFFDGTLVLGTWNGEANAVEPITSFTTLPTVTFDSITVVGTDYVATLTIEFSDPGSFELYYYLTVSDNVVGCTGSSQHSRIGPGSDNVGPSGAQNVPVPANEIIRLPEITVIKNIDRNGDGSFEDTADAGEYCFTLDGGSCVPTDSSGQVLFSNVTPDGDHTVTETQLDFTQGIYEFVSGSGTNCTFSDSTATAEVYAGTTATNATCIFNNGLSVFSPTLVTTPNPTSGTVGVTLNDTATLSDGYNPEGSITFKLYAPGDDTCSGTPVYEETVAVSGNGDYSTSPGFASNAVGTWNWTAEYSGDTHNNPASSGCSDEPVTVNQETPSIVTSASGPVTVGAAIHDTATLSGGYNPTGSITFKLWGPSETATCTGDPIFTADVTVNGNGSYDSPDYTTTAAGTYYWTAEYSGDGNNEDASTSCGDANESSTVNQETPTITTTPNPWSAGLGDTLNDTATLSGGYNPQGTIIFRLYDPSDDTCTGPRRPSKRPCPSTATTTIAPPPVTLLICWASGAGRRSTLVIPITAASSAAARKSK